MSGVTKTPRARQDLIELATYLYSVDPVSNASERLLARRPDAALFGVRIGHRAAYRLVGMRQTSSAW